MATKRAASFTDIRPLPLLSALCFCRATHYLRPSKIDGGANSRFILSSLKDDPQLLYDEIYCDRGDIETRIKEQQLDLYADRTSCYNWRPNPLRLMLSSLAYSLFDHIRRTALQHTRLARATSATSSFASEPLSAAADAFI